MNAIITGASRGIGYYTALKLAEKGYNVLLLSRHEQGLKELAGECRRNSAASVSYRIFDLTNLSQYLPGLIDHIQDQFDSTVDVLINNSGSLQQKGFTEFTDPEINSMLTTNFTAPARLIAQLIPFMLPSDNAHVINITSMGGFQGSVKFPGLSYYSATKGALTILTECLAEEYKNAGIAFNALALGAVQTDMFDTVFPGVKAPLSARAMGEFIAGFAENGYRYFNGKVLPVSSSTP